MESKRPETWHEYRTRLYTNDDTEVKYHYEGYLTVPYDQLQQISEMERIKHQMAYDDFKLKCELMHRMDREVIELTLWGKLKRWWNGR